MEGMAMNQGLKHIVFLLGMVLILAFFSPAIVQPGKDTEAPKLSKPEPVVTYSASDAKPNEKIEHGELIVDVNEARQQLHAQHHPHKVLETRRVPGIFQVPTMKSIKDFAVPKKDLPVINPGPGEYVHVMEGQRHGYKNLTIGITYTAPGGYPPMHTHTGEEAHVLLEGKIMYALGDEIFTIDAPYIVNIPPMVPHSFTNLGNDVAELVVIFPTNVWEYDVLDYFPFKKASEKQSAAVANEHTHVHSRAHTH
jgi:quercetin dioxygenase-like cupin family protein